ncbi:MAG TPA: calcium-binding protein, partial [Solirubrobacteraceae bacterium]|nr:calcium-binding protein [Solirubrobacteraceae bacterium]
MTLLALAFALGAASAAQARVTLVATGTPELAFLGIPGNQVVARLALPGPARAVAVSRDGARGYVSAGSEIVALDVNTRQETGRSAIGAGQPEIADIDLASSGARLYAVRGAQLVVLDAQTLGQLAVIDLRGEGLQIAVANSGSSAAVTLRSGRVAVVSLSANALLRHVKLKGASGVAIADNGLTYVTARERLRVIAPQQRRPRKKAIKLPDGAGGGLTLSPGRSRLVVGAAAGGTSGAIVELRNAKVRRIVAGPGPGRAAWYPDASRIVVADGGAATVSLISPFSRGRIGLVTLPGTTPSDLVVQPGLALMSGTEAADRLTGTRGDDRMQGLGGDDFLRGGRGRDVLDGGLGNDTLSGGNNSDDIAGGDGTDTLSGGTGNDEILGGPGADSADGGTGNDSLQGEDGDDALDGGDGDDSIVGGPGDDTIIEKGFGDDKLLDGALGNDVIRGGRGSDQMILGGDGQDELYGETGSERIVGGPGNDFIDGGRAGDRLEGDEGDDVIRGDAGNDHLYGRVDNDKLDGGSGTDELLGEAGNDELVGGNGID